MSTLELTPAMALKHFFGFDEFKGEQEQVVQSVLYGNDAFVIMPTGGGKSMCYQLPALMMEGTAIVVSPLIALMKNQVDAIRGHHEVDSIAPTNTANRKHPVERNLVIAATAVYHHR